MESGVICEEKDDESVKMRKRKEGFVLFVVCMSSAFRYLQNNNKRWVFNEVELFYLLQNIYYRT